MSENENQDCGGGATGYAAFWESEDLTPKYSDEELLEASYELNPCMWCGGAMKIQEVCPGIDDGVSASCANPECPMQVYTNDQKDLKTLINTWNCTKDIACHNCKEPIIKDQSYGVCGSTRWHLQRWECKAAFVQIPAFEFRAGSFVVSAKVDPADEVLYLQVSRGTEILSVMNIFNEGTNYKTLEIATENFLRRNEREMLSVRNAILYFEE